MSKLVLGQQVYYLANWSKTFKDQELTACKESRCLNWRTRYGDKCGKYGCHFCKGNGSYYAKYRVSCCKIEKKKVLDIKASGSIMIDYRPGFDGGWGGDYYDDEETWVSKDSVYNTLDLAKKALIKIGKPDYDEVDKTWTIKDARLKGEEIDPNHLF